MGLFRGDTDEPIEEYIGAPVLKAEGSPTPFLLLVVLGIIVAVLVRFGIIPTP
ncbi:MAG: hypothetical protein HY433_02745 [Candidatus Liptonbacteria bacterium]|nr:hypothetical protein [Candidatus Liptonbacteria bacterium]